MAFRGWRSKWRSASKRLYAIFVFIFVILDPKNIYLDVLHHVLSRLKYLAPRGWSLKWRSASKRFHSISVFIFVILDPKNIYFDILHHALTRSSYKMSKKTEITALNAVYTFCLLNIKLGYCKCSILKLGVAVCLQKSSNSLN